MALHYSSPQFASFVLGLLRLPFDTVAARGFAMQMQEMRLNVQVRAAKYRIIWLQISFYQHLQLFERYSKSCRMC